MALHEEEGAAHFIDSWTREAALAALRGGRVPAGAILVDLGCGPGAMLADMRHQWPGARLIGVNTVSSALRLAHARVSTAQLHRAEATALPLPSEGVDGLVALSLNVLEHVPEDLQALREIGRVLRLGGRAALWCRPGRASMTPTTPCSATSDATRARTSRCEPSGPVCGCAL